MIKEPAHKETPRLFVESGEGVLHQESDDF